MKGDLLILGREGPRITHHWCNKKYWKWHKCIAHSSLLK
jgi:hypothetical protein